MLLQGLVTVQDVAVSLTWEEWERLDPAQKHFFRESAPKDRGNAVSPSKCWASACLQLGVTGGGLGCGGGVKLLHYKVTVFSLFMLCSLQVYLTWQPFARHN